MDYSLIFDKDDSLKYQILQAITHQPGFRVSQNELFSQFDLSPYKLESAINDLNDDFTLINSKDKSHLDLSKKGVVTGFRLSTLLLQELSLIYINRSPLFHVLTYNFFYDEIITKTEFREQSFLSKTGFYTAELKLKQVLSDSDFYNSQSNSIEEEFTIRLHLFQLYYSLYNGIDSPFKEFDPLVEQIIAAIIETIKKDLLPTQVSKLSVFLRIWLLRINNQKLMTKTILKEPLLLPKVASIIESTLSHVSHENLQTELDFLGAFLIAEDILKGDASKLSDHITSTANALTAAFMTQIKASALFSDNSSFPLAQIEEKVAQINVQFFSFYNEPTTFISADQVQFFQQTYPLYDRIIGQFLTTTNQESLVTLSQNDQVNLYFSYMFTLITIIPTAILPDKVYICVDFSQGTLYTTYVENTLKSFNNVHIVIQHRITDQTDIYLSDFKSNLVTTTQIIWENPPTPHDWSILGDTIIDAKHRRTSDFHQTN